MQIVLENVTKAFGEKRALSQMELKIDEGSFYGIIGPNGAGKSTLLNLIAGLDKPTAGRILYGGNRADVLPLLEMTMVFQAPYLIRTTAEKNISYPLKLRGWPEDKIAKRVDQLTAELGLTEQRKQKAWTLSAGESQKVALARALSFHPKLLLLDEPTANIDPVTTEELERMLVKINQEEGTTILLITHNLAQANRLCEEAAFLYNGSVLEQGNCKNLLREPKHPVTRKFVQGEWLI